MKKNKGLSEAFYKNINLVLGIAVILFTLFSMLQILSLDSIIDKEIAEAEQALKPAEIKLSMIKDSSCDDCLDISLVADAIKAKNVKITKEESIELSKAGNLIDKYNIDKVPIVIVTGETDKVSLEGFEKKGDALVFRPLVPPYIDVKTNKVIGRVFSTIVKDSSCEKCIDLGIVITGLKQTGMSIVSESVVERDSDKGKELIKKYNIEKLPTVILSKDFGAYGSEISGNWDQLGTIEEDGSYVTRLENPPYLDLATNKVRGLVSLTSLIDATCENCYEPDDLHKPILSRMGVVLEEDTRLDVSSAEGKALVDKYSIEGVPTIILEGDAEAYSILVKAWEDVGTVEDDGAYVFRNLDAIGQVYKDLAKDEVITPSTAT